jgi:hypothetical protein
MGDNNKEILHFGSNCIYIAVLVMQLRTSHADGVSSFHTSGDGVVGSELMCDTIHHMPKH